MQTDIFNVDVSFNKVLPRVEKAILGNKKTLPEQYEEKAKPFVKWVGGKRSLLGELEKRLPESYNNYYEPFAGGGALFFHLAPQAAILSDKNLDLIITYTVIRDKPYELIELLKQHKANHSEAYYYEIRKQCDEDNAIAVAARFIYMNKTCYNGLYRVNSKGEFNVPMGTYKNPLIVDESNILACSKILRNITIKYQDYSAIAAQEGDFVYIDPPYHPVNDTSFTKYTRFDFTEADQINLYEFCKKLDNRGVYFMLSNSDSRFIKNLYKEFVIEMVSAPRNINCKPNGRHSAKEVLIRNYK